MDANGGPPGYEAGTPNDAWLADLHNGQSGEYKRAGKSTPTHFSAKAGSGRGTIGYRAAVYHAVITAAKRKSATASTITGSWVALPEHHWCPTLEAPAAPTPAAASRPEVGTRRQADLDGSWRDFVLYFVDHEESTATDDLDEPTQYVLVANEHTVPSGAAHHPEVRLTLAQLFPPAAAGWHGPAWLDLPDAVRHNRVPPDSPAVMYKAWAPKKHLHAPKHDTLDDTDWVRARVNSEAEIQAAVAAAAAAAAVEAAVEAAAAPTAASGAQTTAEGAGQASEPAAPDQRAVMAAAATAAAEAEIQMTAKMIDHVYANPMATAKLRGTRPAAKHSGTVDYHLPLVVKYELRRHPPVRRSNGRARDYGRVRQQRVPGEKGRERDVPSWTYVQDNLNRELDELRERTKDWPPYDRAAAIAERTAELADACLPPKLAPGGGAKAARHRRTPYEALVAATDRWTGFTEDARERSLWVERMVASHAEATGATKAKRQLAMYLERPPTSYEHRCTGKAKRELVPVRGLWASAAPENATLCERAVARSADELALCRKQRALYEHALNQETKRITSATHGMQLRVALATAPNFMAAAWSIFARVRKGNTASRGPDAPLAFIHDSADPTRLIGPGPDYAPEIVKQVSKKWEHKATVPEAVEYMFELTGFANRALPKDPDPMGWLTTEYTLGNLRRQLRKIRPNLAQGHEGPHLYPLSRMTDAPLHYFLGDLRAAVETKQRHDSFKPWRLVFIHKPGRDRYDLPSGCRPIVCLSHLLANDERMMAGVITAHVDAVRSDVNTGYRPGTTLTQTVMYHRLVAEQAARYHVPSVTYFGDMVSFFDEIALLLQNITARRINIPDALLDRILGNATGAEFRTSTPHGVIAGGAPMKGVGHRDAPPHAHCP